MKKLLLILALPFIALTLSAYNTFTPNPNLVITPVVTYSNGYIDFDSTTLDNFLFNYTKLSSASGKNILFLMSFNRPVIINFLINQNPTISPSAKYENVYSLRVFSDNFVNQASNRSYLIFYDSTNVEITRTNYFPSVSTTLTKTSVSIDISYSATTDYTNGYNSGRSEYGYFDTLTNRWQTASQRYQISYDSTRQQYGYYDNGIWYTALEYGDIMYQEGQNNDFDALSWLKSVLTAIDTLFNIQFLPGVTLGAVALIPLALFLLPFLIGLITGGKKGG